MKAGVYLATKKDGSIYYRSSITFKNKHISLGSFSTEDDANNAYLEALELTSSSYSIKRHKMSTHKRKKRLRKNRHKKK